MHKLLSKNKQELMDVLKDKWYNYEKLYKKIK